MVTGASSGIGRACAVALAQAGMRVAICARREDLLADLRAELEAAGAEVLSRTVDVRDESQILDLFEAVRLAWGGVDVLVNNAGLGLRTPLISGETERWREMLEVNVLALCICTREAVQDMRRRDVAGQVVHVSSMSGHRIPDGSGVYSATKYAVRSLTEGLRKELRALGSGIRVAAISPGFVETGFAHVWSGSAEAAQQTYERYPCIQPEEIADALVYLLGQPPHVEVHDILMRPTDQRF
jgi:NADP-dependent 3-hydroxy acid dehydrogenase YdfG